MAKKQNGSADQIDLTSWDWAGQETDTMPPCASCHPGGGPMELDRKGTRYDSRLAADPGLADEFDGDYYDSNWDESGVIEADCLLCHATTYLYNERNQQLATRNYRWAATAGSGLAVVTGSIAAGETPSVAYDERFFDMTGRAVLDLMTSPPDANCLFCHESPDMKKRGFSWNDPANPDVHNLQGMTCVDCHPAGLDHQVAKGNTTIETVRDDLDNGMMGCAECHESGHMGATVPLHLSLPPSHIESIACEACHIPSKGRKPEIIFDVASLRNWDVIGRGDVAGSPGTWYPALKRREDLGGKIVPVNPLYVIWWGNRDEGGVVWPLFEREVAEAWDSVKDELDDANGDWRPEANTREEITLLLRAVEQTLAGGRFGNIHPVYVKGDRAYEFDDDGNLVSHTDPEVCTDEWFSVSHNVAPVARAWGAGGCSDCHRLGSTFFFHPVVTDPFNEGGQTVTVASRAFLGVSGYTAFVCVLHCAIVQPWLWVVIIASLTAIAFHFMRYGPHEAHGDIRTRRDDFESIERFGNLERSVHIIVLLTFLFLGTTGTLFALNGGGHWVYLLFQDLVRPRVWHGYVGLAFGIGVVGMAILWTRDAIFNRGDIEWLRQFGGYLGGGKLITSDRFNAGQKIFFWTLVSGTTALGASGITLMFKPSLPLGVVLTAVIVHDLAAFLGIASVLAHAYLGTLANPGTLQAIFTGEVTKLWARINHPLWYERLTGQPAMGKADRDRED